MSVYGDWKAATISSGSLVSSAIDLGRDYDFISVEIPEMTSCQLYLKVSELLGGTYYDLGRDSLTAQETFNHADVWRVGGWRYIKVAASVEQTADRAIRVRGMRY